jgi:hypothetical protein
MMFSRLPVGAIDQYLVQAFGSQNSGAQAPIVWVQNGSSAAEIGELLGATLSSTITREGAIGRITSVRMRQANGGPEREIKVAETLQGFVAKSPPGYDFHLLLLSDTDDISAAYVGHAFSRANVAGDWRMIYIMEWQSILASYKSGELAPVGQPQPGGHAWKIIKPLYNHTSGTMIYWGLFDLNSLQSAAKPHAIAFCVTTMEGEVMKVATADGAPIEAAENVIEKSGKPLDQRQRTGAAGEIKVSEVKLR